MNIPLEIRLRLTLFMGFLDPMDGARGPNPSIVAFTALILPLLSVLHSALLSPNFS